MAKLALEVEGRLKGIKSLFLDVNDVVKLNDPKNKEILDSVGQVAVSDLESKLTINDISILMNLNPRIYITLETPEIKIPFEQIPDRLNIVLIIDKYQFFYLMATDQIKFTYNDEVYMIPKECFIKTKPEEFDNDEVIIL